jgi:TonB family protein
LLSTTKEHLLEREAEKEEAMRRWMSGVALATLAAALGTASLAQDAGGKPEKAAPRFEPVEVVSTIDPIYPINAVSWGTVILEVTVEETGEPGSIKVLRSLAPFTDQMQRAVKQWKFRPARLDGAPVRSSLIVVGSFPPRPVG